MKMKSRLTKEEHAILAVKLHTAQRILQRAWIQIANSFPQRDKGACKVLTRMGKAVCALKNSKWELTCLYEQEFRDWSIYEGRDEYHESFDRMDDILTEEAKSLNIVTRGIN